MGRHLPFILLAVSLGVSGSEKGYPAGWHWRKAGDWPWEENNERGGYMCLRWNSNGETYDTLLSPVHCCRGYDSCVVRVRTLYQPGRAAPGPDDLPTARILGTVDGWRAYREVRWYGTRACDSTEVFDISSWAANQPAVQLAWVSHIYDTANIRYWCIDDVSVSTYPPSTHDAAVGQLLFPDPRLPLAPGDKLIPLVMVWNKGSRAVMETHFSLDIDGPSTFHYEVTESLPYGFRGPMGQADEEPEMYYWEQPEKWWPREGSHKLTAKVETGFRFGGTIQDPRINILSNDTMSVELLVTGDTWCKVHEYLGPDRMLSTGIALTAGPERSLYFRNPGLVHPVDEATARMLLRYSRVNGNWETVESYSDFYDRLPVRTFQRGGGVCVYDSLLFFVCGPKLPLAKYDIAEDAWSLTSSPADIEQTSGYSVDLLGGLCVPDGYQGRVYAVGRNKLYGYDTEEDSWREVAPNSSIPAFTETKSVCPASHTPAFCGEWLYFVLEDGSLQSYNPGWNLWQHCKRLPVTADRVRVCHLAGDSENGMLYALTDAVGFHKAFIAYDTRGDSWVTALPQPQWNELKYELKPGAALTRSGRYLFAFNGDDNDLHRYNLPAPPEPREEDDPSHWR